ncbi:MAG: hypothetical protein Q9M43_07690 [Sulfurimonas sp.]|nr:hypothetical protein [Sulfurimonas sp.]
MKFILIFLILFSSVANAEYLRSIRISSHPTQAESQQALRTLQEFIGENQNVLDLQKKWDFEFKARKSGRYYITIVRPFTQRKVLQEVIDTLRKNYKDVYVTSLKKKPIKQVREEVIIQIPKVVKAVEEIKVIEIKEPIKPQKVAVIEEPLVLGVPIIEIKETKNNNKIEKIEYLKYFWQVLSVLLFWVFYISLK